MVTADDCLPDWECLVDFFCYPGLKNGRHGLGIWTRILRSLFSVRCQWPLIHADDSHQLSFVLNMQREYLQVDPKEFHWEGDTKMIMCPEWMNNLSHPKNVSPSKNHLHVLKHQNNHYFGFPYLTRVSVKTRNIWRLLIREYSKQM